MKALLKFGLATAVTLLTLLAVEQGLRVVGYEYRPMMVEIGDSRDARYHHTFTDSSFVYDSRLIWRPRPGHGIFNRQGLRGPVLTPDPADGVLRMITIGDSNTLGWAGAEGANWPANLGRLLRRTDPDAEVVNAGVWGYSSYQGLGRLREVLAYRPHLVLVSFGSNDALRVYRSDRDFAGRSERLARLRRLLKDYRLIQLWAAVEHRLAPRDRQPRPRVALEDYRRNLTEMVRLTREAGARVVFLTRPFDGPVTSPLWWKSFGADYNLATVEVAGDEGVPVIDLYSGFKGQSRFFSDESHFTRAGHELAGRLVFTELQPVLATLGR